MRLIVVRHYKTLNNARRRILGWTDSPPVPGWESNLAELDHILRAHVPRFDCLYSSSLTRARETARWFARQRPDVPVRERAELNEVDYGELAGFSKAWVETQCPRYKRDPGYVFPHGESFESMRERSIGCLIDLEREHAEQTLLVVVHAGIIRGLITHFLGLPLLGNLNQKISHRYIGDFSIHDHRCTRYDEIGEPSGFVRDGTLDIPCLLTGSAVNRDAPSNPAQSFRRVGSGCVSPN